MQSLDSRLATETRPTLSPARFVCWGWPVSISSVWPWDKPVGALEATPRIWDLAAAWLVLEELDCPIRWLGADPSRLEPGQDLSQGTLPDVGGCFRASTQSSIAMG
jgi:hypothetical protein